MKKISLLTITLLNFLSTQSSDNPLELKRSNAIIANVWSAAHLAVCGTTLKAFHADCQLDRLTQRCPDCPHWDVEFLPVLSAAQKSEEICGICDKKIRYVPGFPEFAKGIFE